MCLWPEKIRRFWYNLAWIPLYTRSVPRKAFMCDQKFNVNPRSHAGMSKKPNEYSETRYKNCTLQNLLLPSFQWMFSTLLKRRTDCVIKCTRFATRHMAEVDFCAEHVSAGTWTVTSQFGRKNPLICCWVESGDFFHFNHTPTIQQ